MSKRSAKSGLAVAVDLGGHRIEFIASLAKAGYSEKTQRDKKRLIAPFLRWVREAGIAIADVDEVCVDAFLACPSRRRYNHRTALRQFVAHLRIVEAVPPRHSEPSPAEMLVRGYVDHLRDKQGLSPHSIAVYSPFARAFVVAQRLPEEAANLDALTVRSHLLGQSRSRSVSFVRLLAAALRSFLRFCFLEGTTTADLSTAVLPVRQRQLAAIPPFLTAKQIERVLLSDNKTSPLTTTTSPHPSEVGGEQTRAPEGARFASHRRSSEEADEGNAEARRGWHCGRAERDGPKNGAQVRASGQAAERAESASTLAYAGRPNRT